MKKIFIILAICVSIALLCSCAQCSKSYPFPNRDEPIESVELLYYPFAVDVDNEEFMYFELIRKLEQEEISNFMEHLYALKTKQAFGSPPCDYGPYIARVNYENGDAEYFGTRHIELVEEGTEAFAVGIYYFSGDSFEKLFLEYAGNLEYLLIE